MPSLDSGFSSSMSVLLQTGWRVGPPRFSRLKDAKQPGKRIVKAIHNPLFQGDDSVLRNGDVLRANLAAASGDVAVTDAVRLFQLGDAVLDIERMHFERGDVHEKARPGEFIELVMLAQHVAHILAQETLDALADFLHTIDALLLHAPRAVGRIRRTRLDRSSSFLHPKVPGCISEQVR